MKQLRTNGFAALAATFIGAAATAQEGNTTIVLDGSGSMWGQIDGTAKITIAQGALRELLGGMPEDAALGLVAYGHRERGQCNDIETLVSPEVGTRDQILAQLGDIKPKGKTPLSDAVLRAAEGLVYTEERATVILISDGIETCDADPCAVGRRLEETGIDFTAHVIGFDVDGDAAVQLECLATETGGKFLLAENASELSGALEQVATAPPAPPQPVAVTFRAMIEDSGAPLEAGVVWSVMPSGDDQSLLENEAVASPVLELEAGTYSARALWIETEEYRETAFEVENGADPFTVSVSFTKPQPTATVSAPETALAGSDIDVDWKGPGADRDYVSVHTPGEDAYINYSYVEGGSPTSLQMPMIPGQYEIRYYDTDSRALTATQVEVTPVDVSLAPPAEAEVGSPVPIEWTGPDYARDYIAVSEPGQTGYVNFVYTREGSPADLVMPAKPGDYEVRYVASQDNTVLARATITLTEASATISAPDTAAVGSNVVVGWTGPGNERDYISVARPDSEPGQYINYEYTRASEVSLTMPSDPGTYELRYILDEGPRTLETRTITVAEASATISAPDTAMAGSDITVGWTGPGNQRDYVSIAEPDTKPGQYFEYEYTRAPEVSLTMPSDPGTYELRYILDEGPRTLETRNITLTEAVATITAPDTAVRGTQVEVEWTGPRGSRDYLSIARADAADTEYESYSNARDTPTVSLRLPQETGSYELRYVLGKARKVIARRPLEVTLPSARLAVPATVSPGASVQVAWQGPGGGSDRIVLVPAGGEVDQAVSDVQISAGNPLTMTMPEAVGVYELLYLSGEDVLARQSISAE